MRANYRTSDPRDIVIIVALKDPVDPMPGVAVPIYNQRDAPSPVGVATDIGRHADVNIQIVRPTLGRCIFAESAESA